MRIADLHSAYMYTCRRLKEEEYNGHDSALLEELYERKVNLEAMLDAAVKFEYAKMKQFEDEAENGC